MTGRDWSRHPGVRAALAALVVAIGLTLWSAVRAFRGDALPNSVAVTTVSLDRVRALSKQEPTDIDDAVENDLFSDDRSAPVKAYRMPDEDAPDSAAAVQPEKPTVLGTAVATDGRHFATVQMKNARPTLVHVGDTIGVWVVRSIERGKLGLVSTNGTRVDVTAPKPGT
ncbi:MAG TPA: hypothetical protein VGM67_12355 [Gemmatimonadaceae bacterium]|jgi:hypothetical protein